MPKIEYIAEDDVDATMDAALRLLLSSSFMEERDAFFKDRRYYKEYPHHRWFMRDDRGALIAHVAVHEKRVVSGSEAFRFGGIAEVCVHPCARGRGYVGQLLKEAHQWLQTHGFPFAMLFGDPKYYASSGYIPVGNLYLEVEGVRQNAKGAMVCALGALRWPEGDVFLPGLIF